MEEKIQDIVKRLEDIGDEITDLEDGQPPEKTAELEGAYRGVANALSNLYDFGKTEADEKKMHELFESL